MKLKAIAAATATIPLMVACGGSKETFQISGAGATFPAPLVYKHGFKPWQVKLVTK